jgi:serine/threonine-protein kinase
MQTDWGIVFSRTWVPRIVLGALFAVVALRVALVWPELPQRMASHFGIDGRADSFMTRESFFLVMGILGGGSILSLISVPAWLRHVPSSLINMPNRDYWLAPERRASSLAQLGVWVTWTSVATAGLLALAVELTIRANLAHSPLDMQVFVVGLAVFLASIVFMLAVLRRRFGSKNA